MLLLSYMVIKLFCVEDEDELRRRKAGFESHLSELRNRQDRTKAEIAKLKSDYAAMEIEQGRKLSEKGSLESEKKVSYMNMKNYLPPD